MVQTVNLMALTSYFKPSDSSSLGQAKVCTIAILPMNKTSKKKAAFAALE